MKKILFTLALLISFSSFGQQMTNFDLEQNTFNFSIGKTIKEGKMIFSDNSNIDKNSISIALQKLLNDSITIFKDKRDFKKIKTLTAEFSDCNGKMFFRDKQERNCFFSLTIKVTTKGDSGYTSWNVFFSEDLRMTRQTMGLSISMEIED